MSDKNRNMNDINDQNTAEQQAFSEEIRRRLAEPDSGKPTLDEFKVMVYKDREKRRKKRNALVACIVAAFIVGYLAYDDLVPEVGADKNPKETIKTEDGVIIEDGGWGSSEEEDNVFVVEDWEYVIDGKIATPRLLIPQYIPNNYSFKKLTIETLVGDDMLCQYSFVDKENNKMILEVFIAKGEITYAIEDVSKKVVSSKGIIYRQDKENKATIIVDGGYMVSIWSNLPDDEIIKIVDELHN